MVVSFAMIYKGENKSFLTPCLLFTRQGPTENGNIDSYRPASILYKSITARYRFIKNAYWARLKAYLFPKVPRTEFADMAKCSLPLTKFQWYN